MICEKKWDAKIDSRIISLKFTSPTSFKANGHYDIFPDIRKIFRSLMMNFDFSKQQLKFMITRFCRTLKKNHVVSYKLMTKNFHLEKIKVKVFKVT